MVEFGSLSKSELSHITSLVWSEVRSTWTLKKEGYLWDIGGGHSIVHMCLSPLPGQWFVTNPEVEIWMHIYTSLFSSSMESILSYSPFYFCLPTEC